ncbi:MAG: FG-GAP-like repeat-containing protein [Verrucomicrobiota bacterium]
MKRQNRKSIAAAPKARKNSKAFHQRLSLLLLITLLPSCSVLSSSGKPRGPHPMADLIKSLPDSLEVTPVIDFTASETPQSKDAFLGSSAEPRLDRVASGVTASSSSSFPTPLAPLPEDVEAPLIPQPLIPTTDLEIPEGFLNLTKPAHPDDFDADLAMAGEKAAQIYCATCHMMPGPELLDRDTWLSSVLPTMAPGGSRYTPMANTGTLSLETINDPLKSAKILAPAINDQTWQSIVAFYGRNSPEALEPSTPARPIDFELPGFRVEFPDLFVQRPATNTIRIHPDRGHILVGATDPNMFLVFDHNLRLIQEARVSSPPTWFEPLTTNQGQSKMSVTLSGHMDPNDFQSGSLVFVDEQQGIPSYDRPIMPITRLRRPVSTRFGDLNGDGRADPVISQFGDTIGQLAWYESQRNGSFRERILIPRPGSLRSQILDYDDDGDLDVVTLMAQAREGVYLLRNQGNGNFETQILIQVPPVYGSSSFEMVDVNQDGKMDIIQTCGDNADFSQVFKPYHGVYVWENQGGDQFEIVYFYPVNGAFNAHARDYDLDGDIDIACLAYFPDYQTRREESFVYLQNEGGEFLDFHPFTVEQAFRGRWLPMDVGDIDADGDVDIVLGNFLRALMGPGTIPEDLRRGWEEPGPHFMLLRNQAR